MTQTGFKDRYLQAFTRYPQQTNDRPRKDTNLIVVIPCLNEPYILHTLQSIKNAQRAYGSVEVLITVNHSSNAPNEVKDYNASTFGSVKEWAKANNEEKLQFIPLWFGDLKPKLAGVGTARKIGMDEAVYRFFQISHSKGIIVCLDADCKVSPNYLPAIEQHFHDNPHATGAGIAFEHPLDTPYQKAIIDFELYLRYYKNALYWAGFPYAYHTIGSTMAVPCDVYQRVGGMNKQKAGEDFYFLEKLIYQGSFTEINATTVYPSPRQSLRVPFGTGQAVSDYTAESLEALPVFHPRSYRDAKIFIQQLPHLYDQPSPADLKVPLSITTFLEEKNWEYYLQESFHHAHSRENFLKRFFHWFDAFKMLQFLHHVRDYYHPNIPILNASQWLYSALGYEHPAPDNPQEMLLHWRTHDRKPTNKPNTFVPF